MSVLTCGARTRKGTPCGRPAGEGTEHKGFGRCRFHGGATPNGKAHGRRLAAEHAVVTYGLPREVDPFTALYEELYRTQGHVDWLGQMIAAMGFDGLTQHAPAGSFQSVVDGIDRAMVWEKPSIWLELYHRERKHLAEVSKTCIALGIAERQVQLAEGQAQLMAQAVRGILTDLGVADHPQAPAVVRRHFTLVAAAEALPEST